MIHKLLENHKIVLASASPRRKSIFEMIGVTALIQPAHIDETIVYKHPRKSAIGHAREKAAVVAKNMDPDCIVVGSDTIVYLGGEILGKPGSSKNAIDYLKRLSGKTHSVYTGVCVIRGASEVYDCEKTQVTFKELSEEEIHQYLKTGEPFDKAGAYGIQGYGSQFIDKVNGCYFNVMGFPVRLFQDMLHRLLEPHK